MGFHSVKDPSILALCYLLTKPPRLDTQSYNLLTSKFDESKKKKHKNPGEKPAAKTAGKIGGKKFYIYLANGKNLTFFAYFFELASYRGTTMSELGNSSVRSESGGS